MNEEVKKQIEEKYPSGSHYHNAVQQECATWGYQLAEKEIERLKGLIKENFFGEGHSSVAHQPEWEQYQKLNKL